MKFYIYCPSKIVSGGPEALHQLAAKAKKNGFQAAMVYYPGGETVVPDAYKCYDVDVAEKAEDNANSVIIIPEKAVRLLWRFKKATRVIWWLSIDNYIKKQRNRKWYRKAFDRVLRRDRRIFSGEVRLNHAAQSEYAKLYLQQEGVKDVFMLTDHLRTDFVQYALGNQNRLRRDIITYNPLKGADFTQGLIARSAIAAEWIPIKNMTPQEVRDLLSEAKVYIDFGHHPGRDRIPREAVACGCCVLTGNKGSAENPVDVPTPHGCKFNESDKDVFNKIEAKISNIMANFEEYSTLFRPYRESVIAQEDIFESEVGELLGYLQSREARL
ncbi:hypothetical protein [Porticoccus sp.]